jgi:hypothetical protein
MTTRPQATEYAPYYGKYISLVPDGDILALLEEQLRRTTALLASVSEEKADYRYAPEKWTVKQVVGHVTDTERIFAYRALRISRNDTTPIEGFEQDDYVRYGPFETCKMADLVEDFAAVRRATLSLFRRLDAEAWQRRGTANRNQVTVRALAYTSAGHELHHVAILKDRYHLA